MPSVAVVLKLLSVLPKKVWEFENSLVVVYHTSH